MGYLTAKVNLIENSITKYKFDIYFFLCIFLSVYANFILFYEQIESSIFAHKQLLNPLFYTALNSLIFSIPYFFCKRRNYLFFIYLFLVDTLLTSNIIYYHHFNNVIPITSYLNIQNINELIGVITSYLKYSYFVYFLNTFFLLIVYLLFFKIKIRTFPKKIRVIAPILLLTLSISTAAASVIIGHIKGVSARKFYLKDENQPAFVSYFGISSLWCFQALDYIYLDKTPLNESESKHINNYISTNKGIYSSSNPSLKIAEHNKNLIIIVVESLSSWTIKFQNGSATPFLTELSKRDNLIYLPNVLPQTSHGQSSDAQAIFNTGLLPLFNSALVFSHLNQNYPSIADALRIKKYNSLTVMGNKPSTYNQSGINNAFHINKLISRKDLIDNEIIGMGIADKNMFNQLVPILKNKTKSPFYAQIITLSSHDGIDFAKHKTSLKFPPNYPDEICNYIKAIEYVDQAIKQFITDLKTSNLYNESVIVIMADHAGMRSDEIRKYSPELLSTMENGKTTFIPCYILNANKEFKQKKNQVIGYIDIYPTLLDIMNLTNYYWQGMGNSIFSTNSPTFAIDKNLNVIGDTTNTTRNQLQHKIDAWKISDLIIRRQYFNKYIK